MEAKAARMSEDSDGNPLSDDLYERLSLANPNERTALVLRAIEEHPEHRLELPMRNGTRARLEGIHLDASTLSKFPGDMSRFPWWDPEGQRCALQHARLRGADLQDAILSNVDMRNADLDEALLGAANLEHANLDGASLQGADLVGTNLREAVLGEANLSGAMLEDAVLKGSSLRFANLEGAVLEGADMEGTDLWGATLTKAALNGADLQGARLRETKLGRADLTEADLRGALLEKADLEQAILRGADLQSANLTSCNLRMADLGEARLHGVTLTKCDITHISLSGAWLDRTWLRREQLGDAVGEEMSRDYAGAARAYLALEQNFLQIGDPDAASWAYGKKRRMQKLDSRKRAAAGIRDRQWGSAIADSIRFAADQVVEWSSGYGESVGRVLGSMFALYSVFIVIYWLSGSVVRVDHHPASIYDLAVFTLTDASSQIPAGLAPRSEYVMALTGTQTLLSIFLVGLLGFVAGNRIHR